MYNFEAGYQQAIDDLRKRYNSVYSKCQLLWKYDDAYSDAVYKLEIELMALNAAICDLEAHKRYHNVLE